MTLALPETSGAPRMALQYACALTGAGYRVVVAAGAAPQGRSIKADLVETGADVIHDDRLGKLPTRRLARSLAKRIRRMNGCCVIGFQQRDHVTAARAARYAGVPCIWSVQGRQRFNGTLPLRMLKERMYRGCVGLVDRFICTSPPTADEIRRRFGASSELVHILPNGIDTEAVESIEPRRRKQLRRQMGVADDELLLLNVGRITVEKAHDVLLDAFTMCPNTLRSRCRLVIVGGISTSSTHGRMTELQRRLRQFIKSRGLDGRVALTGWRDNVPELLQAADVYVHSSRSEGWPLAVMEAMASGLPVIFTGCSGEPEGFADGRDGFIVPAEDAAELSRAISHLASMDDDSRRRIGEAGRRYCREHYDIRDIGRQFVEQVSQVVRDRAGEY